MTTPSPPRATQPGRYGVLVTDDEPLLAAPKGPAPSADASDARLTSSSRSTSDGRRLMILPVAKRPGPGTDIPLCSVPLSLTWSLTGVSWPTPAGRGAPRNGAVN